MKSCLYVGQVRHRRFTPKAHAFQYALYLTYVDLEELDSVFHKRWLWSTRYKNLAWLRRADHLGDPALPLHEAVRDLVERNTGKRPTGPIRLLTHLRYFGYCFNPVSFYYCYDTGDQKVETIVAEVNNTPWGEQHCYVLGEQDNAGFENHKRYLLHKQFHVSPFMPMALSYDWRFSAPDERLYVHMQNMYDVPNGGGKVFDATLVLERQSMTGANLAKVLLRYPFITGKVIFGIYYQALKMWLKRFPFYEHTKQSIEPSGKISNKEAPHTAK